MIDKSQIEIQKLEPLPNSDQMPIVIPSIPTIGNTPVGGSTGKPNCSRHTKEVAGITDMKQLAEMFGDLHYKTLAEFLNYLSGKIQRDASKDNKNGRVKLAKKLWKAKDEIQLAFFSIYEAWKISEPFMIDDNDDNETSYHDGEFQPCDNCDLPDACADWGCAIKQGIRKTVEW